MKKQLSITALCLILTVTMLGCGSKDDNAGKTSSAQTTEAADPGISTTQAAMPETSSVAETAGAEGITLDEQVLVDQDGVKITATGLTYDKIWGYTVNLLIENNSEQDITVQTRNSSVNGFMVDFSMSCDVAVGKKANDDFTIDETGLADAGIDSPAEIEFYFTIFDKKTWDTIFNSDIITLRTSIADTYTQEVDDSGDVLVDSDGIKVVLKGLSEDGFWGPEIVMYMENNSDIDITAQTRDTSVNGFMIDSHMSEDVAAGKKAIISMYFDDSDLEANKITSIEDLESTLIFFNSDSYDTILKAPIVLTAN
jgi:hypothetical protein